MSVDAERTRFASGSLFSQDLVTDNEELRLQAAEDYFRRFIYPADAELRKNCWQTLLRLKPYGLT